MPDFNPYKVLGLERHASKEEAKKAHRQMAKKYHPDQYTDPVAKELAEEKMAEINRAYDMIESGEAERQYSSNRSNTYGGYNPYGDYNSPWTSRQDYGDYRRNRPQTWGDSASCMDRFCCYLCYLNLCCDCIVGR